MALFKFSNIVISALSCVVPESTFQIQVKENDPKARYARNFIRQTGVRQFHMSSSEQTCVELAYYAAKEALASLNLPIDQIDAIVFLTQTPDFNPATSNAHLIHFLLGAKHETMAMDIPQGCTSFAYGLSISASLMVQHDVNKVLFLMGDTRWPSFVSAKAMEESNNNLFGEAGSAIILEKAEQSSIRIELFADGAGYKYLFDPFSGWRNYWRRNLSDVAYPGLGKIKGRVMDGVEITNFATTTVVDSLKKFLKDNNEEISDYDALVLHQANLQIIKTMSKRLGLSMEKVPLTVDRYGNTSAASIALSIADAFSCDKREKLRLLTCGYGIGLSWGIASLEISTKNINPVAFLSKDKVFKQFLLERCE